MPKFGANRKDIVVGLPPESARDPLSNGSDHTLKSTNKNCAPPPRSPALSPTFSRKNPRGSPRGYVKSRANTINSTLDVIKNSQRDSLSDDGVEYQNDGVESVSGRSGRSGISGSSPRYYYDLASETNTISGFSTRSVDTDYHTIVPSSVKKVFGTAKVKFYGRGKELELLHGVYNEVCSRDTSGNNADSKRRNSTASNASTIASQAQKMKESRRNSATSTACSSVCDSQSTPSERHRLLEQVTRNMALVSGLSGSGKSALVMQFIDDLRNQKDGMKEPLFLAGKFDEMAGADPFSAIVEAYSVLTSILVEGESNNFAEDLVRIQKDVQENLGQEDVGVLTTVAPALSKIFSVGDSSPSPVTNNHGLIAQKEMETIVESNEGSSQNAWNRLKYILQLFTKTIATNERPIVMFLDDLQWADSGSLDIIQALVTDKRIHNFMFIGTYRSDEVEYNHPLSQRIFRIQKMQPIETILLNNLSRDELYDFLNHHMKIEDKNCKRLAKKVHATTNGNMFFVIQILVELNQQCALVYSEFSQGWEWDDIAGMIVLETGISDNLEEAVEMKIKRCPKLIKWSLVTTAYARSTIDIDTLYKLMAMDDKLRRSLSMRELRKALDRAVLEGYFLNNIGSNFYSFAHDKVHKASYSLIPKGKARERFRLSMGKRLYKIGSSSEGETWMLFAAAEHLNSSLSLTDKDPLYLAKMNLDIGERASKMSAWDQASKCLMAGLDAVMMMPDCNPWETHYELTLRLHRAAADVELCLGRFESGNEIGRRLIKEAHSLEDRLPTYESLSLALSRVELHAEALEMNRDALIRLGEYPKRNIILNLLKELVSVQSYMKRKSDEDILNIPKATDKSKEYAVAFVRGFAIQAFYINNLVEFLLGSMRALQITFQYGLTGTGAVAIVAHGLIIWGLGDYQGAVRSCHLGRRILDLCEDKQQESVFRFSTTYFIESWVDSHEKTLECYRQGHLFGMEVGDVESAFLNSYGAIYHARSAGSPLGSIEIIEEELLEQMEVTNNISLYGMLEQVHLAVRYLTGTHNLGVPYWEELGKAPNFDLKRGSENLKLMHWYISRVELGIYFRNFEFADRMANTLRSVVPRHTAYVTLSFRLFYSGLAASGMARQMTLAGKRIKAMRYRAKAKRYAKSLGKISHLNGTNNRHRVLLMLADLNIPGKEQTPVSYDKAINACLEVGHIHDAALASELAGEYFLTSDKSERGSVAGKTRNKVIRRHFTRARDLYSAWGAHAKVDHLYNTRGDYIEGRQTETTESEGGGVISIDLDNEFSAHSSEDLSDAPPKYNSHLVRLLAGIVPSSDDKGILLSMPDDDLMEQQELSKRDIDNDDLSDIASQGSM